MRSKTYIYQILILILIGFSGWSQTANEPQKFEDFYHSDKMDVKRGFFNIYSENNRYFIEIPEQSLGKDVFIGAQIIKGYSSYVSNQSGVYHFKLGRNNQLDLYVNKSRVVAHDSVDYAMVQAIEKSGLVPALKSYQIVAKGEKEDSFIIELTHELSPTGGLFSLNSPGPINSPDPSRSGLDSFEATENGVIFKGNATQSSFGPSPSGKDENIISAYEYEMVLEILPDYNFAQKENHLAYGFNTVEQIQYSTKNYRANAINYVKRWNLTASAKNKRLQKKGIAVEPERPIQVWIDPITPDPFVDCVKEALNKWEEAFEEAGWKNVFQIVNDVTQGYKKINFFWGNAYGNHSFNIIDNPVTGEILAARVNFMDAPAKDKLLNYLLFCGENDPEIVNNVNSLKIRNRILTSQLEGVLGKILGLKENYPAVTAFSISQLNDSQWLKKWGPSATVVGASTPNYVVRKENKISPEYFIPKVSIYDFEAIDYLYGDRTESPSLKSCFYAESNILDPTAQETFISNDLLTASEIGLNKLKAIYAKIPEIVSQSANNTNISSQISILAGQSFSLYKYFVNQEAVLIGGQMNRHVLKGENEVPVKYVSKQDQLKALKALEANVFSGTVKWLDNPGLMKIYPTNIEEFTVNISENILRRLFKKEVLVSLIEAEKELGNKAFKCDDLFDFINRVVFLNFDSGMEPTQIQMSTQVIMVNILTSLANGNNITGGVNDLSATIHLYLMQVRNSVEKLLNSYEASDEVKNNCKLMLLRFNREYFN